MLPRAIVLPQHYGPWPGARSVHSIAFIIKMPFRTLFIIHSPPHSSIYSPLHPSITHHQPLSPVIPTPSTIWHRTETGLGLGLHVDVDVAHLLPLFSHHASLPSLLHSNQLQNASVILPTKAIFYSIFFYYPPICHLLFSVPHSPLPLLSLSLSLSAPAPHLLIIIPFAFLDFL